MTSPLIGVIDIGKTHARFATTDPDDGTCTESRLEHTPVVSSPLIRQLDVAGIESWLINAIKQHPHRDRIGTLVPIAHGAAGVLLDAKGEVLIAPDYEDVRFDEVGEPYRAVRDPFEVSYSPFLPRGLNLGRQLFFLQSRQPQLLARAQQLLLYPQYWAWRLSGVAASELTSLGCHSDLWRPLQKRTTKLARDQGWDRLLPALRDADHVLGEISAPFRYATGLGADCRVLCGLHDSNASFLAHLAGMPASKSMAVVSSGTWTVVMAQGIELGRLREPLDMLANIDVFGKPVATARFMGGREYEVIAGEQGMRVAPSLEALASLLSGPILALPSFSETGGPFPGRRGQLVGREKLTAGEGATLATLYIALMTDYVLDLLGFTGDIVVDGPLAQNEVYLSLLATLRERDAVHVSYGGSPAVMAASYLAGITRPPRRYTLISRLQVLPEIQQYRDSWREAATRAPEARRAGNIASE